MPSLKTLNYIPVCKEHRGVLGHPLTFECIVFAKWGNLNKCSERALPVLKCIDFNVLNGMGWLLRLTYTVTISKILCVCGWGKGAALCACTVARGASSHSYPLSSHTDTNSAVPFNNWVNCDKKLPSYSAEALFLTFRCSRLFKT